MNAVPLVVEVRFGRCVSVNGSGVRTRLRFVALLFVVLCSCVTSLRSSTIITTAATASRSAAASSAEIIRDSTKRFQEVMIVGEREREVPASGVFMDAKALERLNQPDVNKVMRLLPGVNVRDEEGFGLRPNIGLRGTQVYRCSKITVMEDGILTAPAPYADPESYYFPTFARMEGVEVLKGSSQIEYGPFTIGGAINLISTSIPDSFKGFAELGYGSFATQKQRIWLGDSKKNVDYVFDVLRMSSNGFKELDNGGNTGFDRRDVMGKIRLHTSEGTAIEQSLTLKFLQVSELGNESYLGLTYDDYDINPLRRYAATQKDLLNLSNTQIALTHTIDPMPGLTVITTGYQTRTFREWGRVNSVGGVPVMTIIGDPVKNATADSIMTGMADGNLDYRSAARRYVTTGVQSTMEYNVAVGETAHRIRVGVRYHRDESDRLNTSTNFTMTGKTMVMTGASALGNIENQIRSASATAAFVQYRLMKGAWTLTPGVRMEHIDLTLSNYGTSDNARRGTNLLAASNTVTAVLPGIGLNVDVADDISLFAGMHRGFSPPGMPSTSSVSAQAIPEKAWNYETGLRSQRGGVRTSVVGFLCDYQNILGSDNLSGGGLGNGDLFNAGAARVIGAEVGLQSEVSLLSAAKLTMPLNLSYTFTDARFKSTFVGAGGDWGTSIISNGDVIPFIPPHQLSLQAGIATPLMQALVTCRYTSSMRTKPGQGDGTTPSLNGAYSSVNALPQTFFIDASFNYIIGSGCTVSASLTNILNSTAIVSNQPQGYRPSMPRSINAGLKFDI